MHLTGQAISDMKNATMANTQTIAKLEGQFYSLLAELNRMEKEELQSQLMAGHYMIDEDESSNSCHEHVPAITIFESEETMDNNEKEEKEELLEHTEPPPNPNLSNDKEISIKAHSFITIPFETLHEPLASVLQCLKVQSRDIAHKVTNLGIIFLRRSFEASE